MLTMHSVCIAAAAIALRAVSASPVVQMSPCASQMNGKLPSFTPPNFHFTGNVRKYYVATNEVEWDYVPSGYDNIRGVPLTESNIGKMYVQSNTSLGTKYIKGLYQGYTDATFTERTPQPDWLGYQGPVMRAEVGDMIEVLVFNNFTSDWSSMHSMGLFYLKTSEGSDYWNQSLPDGSAVFTKSMAIPPGQCWVYKWLVPTTSAPLASQPSKLWSYHGDINLQQDVDTGLVGPMIVYQTGKMNQTLSQNREFVLLYSATHEHNSVFFGKSVQKYLPSQYKPPPGPSIHPTSPANESIWNPIDIDMPDSALPLSLAQAPTHLNGYLYANLPGLRMCYGDNIIWYIYALGTFADGFHVFHPHGHNVQDVNGENVAVYGMLPSSMLALAMTTYNPGVWNIICHTADHFEQGMVADYQVYMPGQCPTDVAEVMNVVM